jgi:hypothetical protein
LDWETNPPEEAVYPLNIADGEGKPIDGANKYVIHFKNDEAASRSILVYHYVR